MSATNVTTYYEFPVFVGSDKPAWLVDWNGAMNAIDSAIHEAKAEADANASNISSLQSDVTSLAGSVSSQGSSITSLTQSLTSLQGTVNTITSLIGNGLPTTDDKTIIGAINELKAEIDALDPSGQGVQAENVSYDNTDSDLTATNVQDAIDEVNGKIPSITTPDAEDVSYDNTDSGLTATNVQDAIDELASGVSNANNLGTAVSLNAYTSFADAYVAPSDGYAQADATGCRIRVYGANATADTDPYIQILSPADTVVTVFVRKGMKIYRHAGTGGTFYPFV